MAPRLEPGSPAHSLVARYKRLRRAALASLGYDDTAAYWNKEIVEERVRTLAYLEAHPESDGTRTMVQEKKGPIR